VAVLFNPKTAPYFALFLRSIESGAASVGLPWIAAPVHDVIWGATLAARPIRFMRLPTTSPTSCGRWRRRNL
jgi:hypothetical protein